MNTGVLYPLQVMVLITLSIFVGCSSTDDPVAPWLGDRPGQGSDPITIEADTAAAETTYTHIVAMGSSGVLFVGRDGGYETRSLFRFSVTDTTLSDFRDSKIVLTFQLGQEVVPVRFLLYRITDSWNESIVTWERARSDSLGDVLWSVPGGDFDPLPIAEAGPDSIQADTVRVVFSIPADITADIFAAGSEDNGFLVTMAGEGMEQAIWRFESREQAALLRPQFEVGYTDTVGTDTVKVLYANADAALAERVSALDEGMLFVGSGYGLRSLIRFSLPTELDSTVTINRALLHLYCDTTRMFLETKTLQVELVDSGWRGDSTAVVGGYIDQALAVPGTSEIAFEVANAVLQWISGATENHGFLIRFSIENNAVAYCPIYTSQAQDPALVPRLEITYTRPPSPPVDLTLSPVQDTSKLEPAKRERGTT